MTRSSAHDVLLSGPSPGKDTPQARFRDNVLSIKTEKDAQKILFADQPPPPREPPPPPPLPPPPSLKSIGGNEAIMDVGLESMKSEPSGPSHQGMNESSYGRLSPSDKIGFYGIRAPGPRNSRVGAGGGMAALQPATGPAEVHGLPSVSTLISRDTRIPAAAVSAVAPPSIPFSRPPPPPFPPTPASETLNNKVQTTTAAPSSTRTVGYLQRLSMECQKRKFNLKWVEERTFDDTVKYGVELQGHLVQTAGSYPSEAAAKQAVAKEALKTVRQWPVPTPGYPSGTLWVNNRSQYPLEGNGVVPAFPAQAPVTVLSGSSGYGRLGMGAFDGVDDVSSAGSASHLLSRSTDNTTRSLTRSSNLSKAELDLIVNRIERLFGDSALFDHKKNPATAKAFLDGFAVGSRAASNLVNPGSQTAVNEAAHRSRPTIERGTDERSHSSRYQPYHHSHRDRDQPKRPRSRSPGRGTSTQSYRDRDRDLDRHRSHKDSRAASSSSSDYSRHRESVARQNSNYSLHRDGALPVLRHSSDYYRPRGTDHASSSYRPDSTHRPDHRSHRR